MDFIEQWFGIAPDGGDGSTEAFFIIVAAIALMGLIAAFVARRTGWLRVKSAR
jgi:hypothetical protein